MSDNQKTIHKEFELERLILSAMRFLPSQTGV